MDIFLTLLAGIGLTAVIVRSEIVRPYRELLLQRYPKSIGYLATCHQCTGFWAGFVMGLFVGYPFFMAFAVSGCALFFDHLLEWVAFSAATARRNYEDKNGE